MVKDARATVGSLLRKFEADVARVRQLGALQLGVLERCRAGALRVLCGYSEGTLRVLCGYSEGALRVL
jgi:hypothetical protein